jgi:hypothetical protein
VLSVGELSGPSVKHIFFYLLSLSMNLVKMHANKAISAAWHVLVRTPSDGPKGLRVHELVDVLQTSLGVIQLRYPRIANPRNLMGVSSPAADLRTSWPPSDLITASGLRAR